MSGTDLAYAPTRAKAVGQLPCTLLAPDYVGPAMTVEEYVIAAEGEWPAFVDPAGLYCPTRLCGTDLRACAVLTYARSFVPSYALSGTDLRARCVPGWCGMLRGSPRSSYQVRASTRLRVVAVGCYLYRETFVSDLYRGTETCLS
eukprot:172927-Rhodomonas_salina.1